MSTKGPNVRGRTSQIGKVGSGGGQKEGAETWAFLPKGKVPLRQKSEWRLMAA
jgi:hypothetical protein